MSHGKRWVFDPGSGQTPAEAAAEPGVDVVHMPNDKLLGGSGFNKAFEAVAHKLAEDGEQRNSGVVIPNPPALPLVQMPLGERWQWVAAVLKQLEKQRRKDADAITVLQNRVLELEQALRAHDSALRQHGQGIVGLINGHNQVVAHLHGGADDERRIVLPS